jgi:hypothetical protein
MSTQKSQFNQILLVILGVLYVVTVLGFSYFNWIAAPAGYYTWWMVLLNILILSIPTIALYGSIYVLVIAWRAYTTSKENPRLTKILHWAARIATLMIIVFISLFSLDVFESEGSPLELLGGFIIHNIPSIVLIILLLFAWKRPVVGFVGFLLTAILAAIFFAGNGIELPNMIMFVLPLLLIASLFYADWKWKNPKA